VDNPNSMLPLTPAAFHILLVLVDGELHGYGIMQQIKHISGGALNVGPGTLYRSIQQMIEKGLIAEVEARIDPKLDDERRRYYRLTDFGQRVVQAEAERMAALVKVAQAKRLLTGGAS
jgi:DNA-binding PadR family transcriptional regulator